MNLLKLENFHELFFHRPRTRINRQFIEIDGGGRN